MSGGGLPPVTVALAGNPNVGKSTIFNALTGMRQHTGNWPGKTVENARGLWKLGERGCVLVDIPGCYSLWADSAEEEVARDFLCTGRPDAAVVVCDATCLERSLTLALQVMEVCPRVVVAVNLMDEAKKKGICLDLELLSRRLGASVVGLAARGGVGLKELGAAVEKALAGEGRIPGGLRGDMDHFIKRSEAVCRGVVSAPAEPHRRDRRLDRIFTGKYTALPVMLLMLLGVLWLTVTGANYPSGLLAAAFETLGGALGGWLEGTALPPWLVEALMEGVYGVTANVVAVMLPPMAIFFPLFTLLEDLGYLPRVAFDLDRCFHACHACGKQALTMCMGLGCNAVGVTGCRIIDSPRERLIAILTNSLVPCNGRFPTLMALITLFLAGTGQMAGAVGAALLAGVILLGVGATFVSARLLSATALKGEASSFVLELPPYRVPQVGRVILRSVIDRTVKVLARAVAAAAPAGLLIWVLANVTVGEATLLARFTGLLEPLGRFLGLDGVILAGFLLALPANEIALPIILMAYTAGGGLVEAGGGQMLEILAANGWSVWTAAGALIFTLFHWPCATTLLTIRKETGSWKWTALAAALPTAWGVAGCLVVRCMGLLLG